MPDIIVRRPVGGTVQLAPQTQAALFCLSIWTEDEAWDADAATVDAARAEQLVRLARADGFTVEGGSATGRSTT